MSDKTDTTPPLRREGNHRPDNAPFAPQEDGAAGLTPWSKDVWLEIDPILKQIMSHPFIAGLLDGSLPRETFVFYIGQDALYLADFGRILAAAALKAPRAEDAAFLCESALSTVQVEGALHEGYLKDEKRALAPTPANLLYTSFLHRHLSRSPFSVIMASLLPCFWIYLAVGRHIQSLAGDASGNPYRDWIDTYGSEDFARSVDGAIRLCDRLAAAETPARRAKMTEAFVLASRMEWMFWDSAWRLESWPV
ncbi:MAG: thiaminase II [Deltaproteobacteria bacterium]|jgi:thiaminase/transcriptional activator TenA|nr:thiaminase II [Deltaproteobacteria bacterium]